MTFPLMRMRRLRRTPLLRSMVRETHLRTDDLIYPLFVLPGAGMRREIGSMPGQFQRSVDLLLEECERAVGLDIPAVMLFGVPDTKDPDGSGAWREDGCVQQALRAIKGLFPDLVCIADACLCAYTTHGHCGRMDDCGEVDNDATLELLGRVAVSLAKAGADMVAPSDMMDGRVRAIRDVLDANRFQQVAIMSYAAKFASACYGPFRDAAQSAPGKGDRQGYQIDPANAREALREMELDAGEGADILMVKPALAYLDILREARNRFDHPLAAYNVSGEYAMVKAAAGKGWIDEKRVMMEMLTSMKRAGADMILTYFAPEAAEAIQGEGPESVARKDDAQR